MTGGSHRLLVHAGFSMAAGFHHPDDPKNARGYIESAFDYEREHAQLG
ncbi:hypothetical protein [Paraburkholderia sp. MM5482-R1]